MIYVSFPPFIYLISSWNNSSGKHRIERHKSFGRSPEVEQYFSTRSCVISTHKISERRKLIEFVDVRCHVSLLLLWLGYLEARVVTGDLVLNALGNDLIATCPCILVEAAAERCGDHLHENFAKHLKVLLWDTSLPVLALEVS